MGRPVPRHLQLKTSKTFTVVNSFFSYIKHFILSYILKKNSKNAIIGNYIKNQNSRFRTLTRDKNGRVLNRARRKEITENEAPISAVAILPINDDRSLIFSCERIQISARAAEDGSPPELMYLRFMPKISWSVVVSDAALATMVCTSSTVSATVSRALSSS